MPKAQGKAIPISPTPVSWRAVPDNLGGGRVVLHDAQKGLPELLVKPKKGARWVLIHFPSRRHVVVMSKAKGLAVLKEIHSGEDKLELLPPVEKKKKGGPPAKGGEGTSRTGARASKTKPEPEEEEAEEADAKRPQVTFTAVPDGLGFDAAMDLVFPNQRITRKLEEMLAASRPIYSKEGDYLGEEPCHLVQLQAVKHITDYMKGRPVEKPPPPPEKKKVSFEELEKMVAQSPNARAVLRDLIEAAEKADAEKEKAKQQSEAAAGGDGHG